MQEDKKGSVSELKMKRIVSFLPTHQEINASMMVKLYTGDCNGITWLDSSLDGILCYITDYSIKTFFLIIYDKFTYETLFQYELYHESFKKVTECAPGFMALEVENGFLGFLFEKEEECNALIGIMKKFGAFGQNLFQGRTPANESLKNKEKAGLYLSSLKERFITDDMKKYDENFMDDGLEIVRSRNVEILAPIYYGEQEGKFLFDELSEELKTIFRMNGIKKKDMEDTELGYSVIKKIILIVSGNEAIKEKVFGAQTIRWDRPDEERKIPPKVNETNNEDYSEMTKPKPKPTPKPAAQPKPLAPRGNPSQPAPKTIPVKSNPTPIPTPTHAPTPKQNTQNTREAPVKNNPTPAAAAVPPPPPPPPLIIPTAKPKTDKPKTDKPVEKKPAPAPKREAPQLSMEEQLKAVKLKKVEKKVEENIVTNNEKTFLQAALSNAIANRRRNLMQHEDENSSDEDDW